MSLGLLFLYSFIFSVGLSGLVGIAVLIFGDPAAIEVRILMPTLSVTVASILGLACRAYFEAGRGRVLPLLGIVLSVGQG